MRLIIAGGRTFHSLDLMIDKVDEFLSDDEFVVNRDDAALITIISGTARGADQTGERYAALRGYSVERYPAQWDVYGRSAGYKRNEQMAKIATHCIVFWDGQSRGSKHMLDLATKHGLEVRVVRYHSHNGMIYNAEGE